MAERFFSPSKFTNMSLSREILTYLRASPFSVRACLGTTGSGIK